MSVLLRSVCVFVFLSVGVSLPAFAQLLTPNWQLSGGTYGADIDTFERANEFALYLITDRSTFFSSDEGQTWTDIHPPAFDGAVSPDGSFWVLDTPRSHRWSAAKGWQTVTFPDMTQHCRFFRTLPGDWAAYDGRNVEISTDDGQSWVRDTFPQPNNVDAYWSAMDFDGNGHAVGYANTGLEPAGGEWYASMDDGRTFTAGNVDIPALYVGFGNDSILYVRYASSPHLYGSKDYGKTIKELVPTTSAEFEVLDGRPVMFGQVHQSASNFGLTFSFDLGKTWATTTNGYYTNPSFIIQDTGVYFAYSQHNELSFELPNLTVTRVSNFGKQFDTLVRSEAAAFETNFLTWGSVVVTNPVNKSIAPAGAYISFDDGVTWKTMPSPNFSNFNSIDFCIDSSGTFYFTSRNDTSLRLLHSTDSGRTWHSQLFHGTPKPSSLAVLRDTVFTSFDSAIFRSIDHGNSWQTVTTVPWDFARIVVNPKTGAILLTGSFVDSDRVSLDGGKTFAPIYRNLQISNVLSADIHGNLWMTDTTLHRSTDNGLHWEAISLPIPYKACFIDPLGRVWTELFHSRIYVSGNAGLSWDSCSTDDQDFFPAAILNDGSLLVTAGSQPPVFPRDERGTLYRATVPVNSSSDEVRAPAAAASRDALVCYPDPALEKTSFELPARFATSASISVRIWNLGGELMRTMILPNTPEINLSLAGLTSGVYRLDVRGLDCEASGALIVR